MAQQEPRYAVDASAVIEKLQAKLGAVSYEHALAEAAIDQLMSREARLVAELQQAQTEKQEAEEGFHQQLKQMQSEITELREAQ